MHNAGMAYRRYLERAGFPQDDHWSLSVEQRLMWMILDDNTRVPMSNDDEAEARMMNWARSLRRHFGYHYTREEVRAKFYEFKERYRQFQQIIDIPGVGYEADTFRMNLPSAQRQFAARVYPLARRYFEYPEPHYPSMCEVWGDIRAPQQDGAERRDAPEGDNSNAARRAPGSTADAPIIISDSTAPNSPTVTHVGSWDAVRRRAHVAVGPRIQHSVSQGPRRSLDLGSAVSGVGSWTDYIRHFGEQSDRAGHSASEGDSTARSRRPLGHRRARQDVP